MSILNLDKLLRPASVALIGASNSHNKVGNVVMRNLIEAGFNGPVFPVNPKYRNIRGVYAYADISDLPLVPDLAVICTPAITVPDLVGRLGKLGTRAVVVLSAGLNQNVDGSTLEQQMLDAAKPFGLRILGPNCVGLLVPGIGLNASFAHTSSLPGRLALLSQSGALCTTILDWAKSRGIGFSHFISMGDSADIDFGDLLDYLANDRGTTGILLYIESIKHARKFMSAARAASRNKHVIVIKAGRSVEGAQAAASHTGALAGNDHVFDAAIRRAGMLRVETFSELFAAVETLAYARAVEGKRLLILTNGGGPGVLAADYLIDSGGSLAKLSDTTIASLDQVLPPIWSRSNPVDIIGDSDARRYVEALTILQNDPDHDAVLVLLVPSAVIDNSAVAAAIAEQATYSKKTILTCWMGQDGVSKARAIFRQAAIPAYNTPEDAIRAFMQMVDYRQNQLSLIETPSIMATEFNPDRKAVAGLITDVLAEDRELLNEYESKKVLAAYAIPVVETRVAADISEAVNSADELGYPVALKINSRDISHKSDVGGVVLDIGSSGILQNVAEGMLARIKRSHPDAGIDGFTVQPMIHRPNAQELIIGISTDPVFGPVIMFGEGGVSVELIRDNTLGLPPLNMALASQMIDRTRISRLLAGYRNIRAADMEQIKLTLIKISQLVIDHPEVVELDINPLYADSKGVIALDARIRVNQTNGDGEKRLAIRPYPQDLEEEVGLEDMTFMLRPIRPEDEAAHNEFFRHLSTEDAYFRFFRAGNYFTHQQVARFTQIDYDREMAFIASRKFDDGHHETFGVVRAVTDADNIEAEFAVIVRSDFHGHGLGATLMQKIINYCKARGTQRLTGQALHNNTNVIRLAKKFGFSVETTEDDRTMVNLKLELDKRPV
ncbi:MAG: bifunctional acetate--CoA ligase family protein/GNAT family N-acetyltransferase [Gammaproteobacteria bacterium]